MCTGIRIVLAWAGLRRPQVALRPPALALPLLHHPERLGEIAGPQARLPLHGPDLLARLLDDPLHGEPAVLAHLGSHGGLRQLVLSPPDLPDESDPLFLGKPGPFHALPDPPFRLLDRVRVPAGSC